MKQIYREYFAAANGFSGFRSYFDKIFAPEKFRAIYILKGGPGTGKSTLMKKLLSNFKEKGYSCDAIYCSSDPVSLDGVIIDGKVAVIDGTAPHEMDTKLPGALDEIVNLGEGWDGENLKKSRSKIEEINKIKKLNYSSAYKYLSFSGNIHDYKIKRLKRNFLDEKASKRAAELMSGFKKAREEEEVLLLSSFSRDGLLRRKFSGLVCEKIFSVTDIFGADEIFMNILWHSSSSEFPIIRIPSPLSDNITEGLYFRREKILVISNYSEGEQIDASQYIPKSEDAEIDFLNKTEKIYMEKSKEFFEKASKAHFLLEDIYKEAMDFDKIQEIYRTLSIKVEKILSY